MKVIKRKAAKEILMRSLFHPVNGKTLSIGKFDSGKYKWTGTQDDYVGREVQDIEWVHAVFVERRKDKDGVYAQLMCVHETK